MTGLKQYPRDRELCARFGDKNLRLPEDNQLLEWVARHLCPSGAPSPTSANLVFARWKPAIAVLGNWDVKFSDGTERFITWKSYAGEKASAVGSSFRVDDHMLRAATPLAAFAYLPKHSGVLTSFPIDRILRGASRVMDMRRTGRDLDKSELWPGKVLRRQSSRLELLRYKPERRVVLRLNAKLKNDRQGKRVSAGERQLGVRVLSQTEATRVIANRSACRAQLLPRLLHSEPEVGLLYEEWIDGQPILWDDFSHASESAGVLLGLHQEAMPGPPLRHTREGAQELISRFPGLSEVAEQIPQLGETKRSHWVHGDFHADQLTQTADGLRLLDADALRAGAPEEDLASWIADHLQHDLGLDLEAALAPLLAGYGAGLESLDPGLIVRLTAEQLIQRAAAGLRRLEQDSPANAALLLDRARRVCIEKVLL